MHGVGHAMDEARRVVPEVKRVGGGQVGGEQAVGELPHGEAERQLLHPRHQSQQGVAADVERHDQNGEGEDD